MDSLSFSKVKNVSAESNLATAVTLLAILKVHDELPRDERGVATTTIRELIRKFAAGINPILAEYVCAFGSHGVTVLNRYIERYAGEGISQDEVTRLVESKYIEFKTNL